MARLVLLNGVPEAGKQALAPTLAEHIGAQLIDLDAERARLVAAGRTPADAKRTARENSLEQARSALVMGGDVLISDLVVRPDFADELAAHAGDVEAHFLELLLVVAPSTLPTGDQPRRAAAVAAATRDVLLARPRASRVTASDSDDETLARLLACLDSAAEEG